jgi:glycine hydroxymethyltransferase
LDPSGIRIGTPALTSRGMKETEVQKIANWINATIENYQDDSVLKIIKKEVVKFCKKFPLNR